MKKVYTLAAMAVMTLMGGSALYAQGSMAKQTKILEQQLNLLASAANKQSGEEKFEFNGCDCKYSLQSKGNKDGFNMSKTNSFNLKEVSSVSYARNENNTYELRLKLKTEDNAVTQAFDLSSINVNLNTSDEKQIKDLTSRFKNAVKTCSGK
jgi:hypothetical protein